MSVAYISPSAADNKNDNWDRSPQPRAKAELARINKRRAYLHDRIETILRRQFHRELVYSRAARICRLTAEYNALTLRILALELL